VTVPIVDEATKYLITQGILGVYGLVASAALAYYVRDNRRLLERLIQKSETDRNVNRELAHQVKEVVRARRRRPTRAMGEPVPRPLEPPK
jgi:hypothetical protein